MHHLIAIWMALANSPHVHGTWRVEHQGEVFRGDWKITSKDRAFNAGVDQSIDRRWVHYASTTSADYCAFALEDPTVLYCRNAATCAQPWSCRPVRLAVSALREVMRPAEPTLADERRLFARIHQRSLEAQLSARGELRGDRFQLAVPHRTDGPKAWLGGAIFERQVTTRETTFSIGPRPRDVTMKGTRMVETFTERCTLPAHHARSCMPPPPTCARR